MHRARGVEHEEALSKLHPGNLPGVPDKNKWLQSFAHIVPSPPAARAGSAAPSSQCVVGKQALSSQPPLVQFAAGASDVDGMPACVLACCVMLRDVAYSVHGPICTPYICVYEAYMRS